MCPSPDIFAPPTKEEMEAIPGPPSPPDMFAPPTSEELAQPHDPISGAAGGEMLKHEPAPDAPPGRFTPGQSAILGAGKFGSYDFGDRIGAGAKTFYDWLRGRVETKDVPAEYDKLRDFGQRAYDQAAKENPGSFYSGGAAATVGAGAMMGAPGAALRAGGVPAAATTPIAAMAGRFGRAAAQGGAMGLGGTADLTDVPQAARDAAEGASAAVVGHGVLGEAAPFLARGGATGMRNKLGSVVFGVSEPATERFAARPDAVRNAAPIEEKARPFSQEVKAARGELSADSTRGFGILDNSGITTSHHSLTQPLQDAAVEISSSGAYGPGKKEGLTYLRSLMQDVQADFESQGQGGQLGLGRGKNLVMTLQNKIDDLTENHGDPIVLRALIGARQAIDGQLKTQVPEYATHMEDVARRTSNLKALGGGLSSDNPQQVMTTMKGVMSGRRPFDDEAMKAFDAERGTNYSEELKDAYAKRAFEQPTTNGSRRTKWGSAVGGAVGALFSHDPIATGVASAAGASTGMVLDRYGGPLWMSALQAGAIPAKAASMLNAAMQRGGAAPAVTHELLMRQDPDYRQSIQSFIQRQQGATQ